MSDIIQIREGTHTIWVDQEEYKLKVTKLTGNFDIEILSYRTSKRNSFKDMIAVVHSISGRKKKACKSLLENGGFVSKGVTQKIASRTAETLRNRGIRYRVLNQGKVHTFKKGYR